MERPVLLPRFFRPNARRGALALGTLVLVGCAGGPGRPPGAGSAVVGASAAAAPLKPEQRLLLGRQLLEASDYAAAEAHFRAAAVGPRRGPGLVGLAEV